MTLSMTKKLNNRAAKPGKTDLVYGLGKSGLSVARYMQRQGSVPGFIDSFHEQCAGGVCFLGSAVGYR